jgi:cardiolipin synthase
MLSNIPNLITVIRFLLVVPISIFIYQGQDLYALILFIAAGLSDGLDGYLARKFSWMSEFGQIADPLADKCLIIATLLALAFSEKLPLWVVYLMLSRDGLILIGAILYMLMFDSAKALPNRWGKHYTGWTIALFIIVLLRASFDIFPILLEWISTTGVVVFAILSFSGYSRNQGKRIFKNML